MVVLGRYANDGLERVSGGRECAGPVERCLGVHGDEGSGLCAFGNLAEGATIEEFLDWFPGVEEWQVKAVLEHEETNLEVHVNR